MIDKDHNPKLCRVVSVGTCIIGLWLILEVLGQIGSHYYYKHSIGSVVNCTASPGGMHASDKVFISVKYRYVVDGQAFFGDGYSHVSGSRFACDRFEMPKYAGIYAINSPVDVYYCPLIHSIAVLNTDVTNADYVQFAGGAFIIFAGVFVWLFYGRHQRTMIVKGDHQPSLRTM